MHNPLNPAPRAFQGLFILLLIVGIVFRFVNLNHKIVWHDEAYTVLRASGYTRAAIDEALFQNRIMPASELQRFQQIRPRSAIADTINSLVVEDPQHPPLYFVLSRLWVQAVGHLSTTVFHSNITAWRLLPALLSLLALPLMYALAWELFASQSTALLATTLLALSPFDVLFAQTARQYSLLTVMVIGSQWALLRALRLTRWAGGEAGRGGTPRAWLIYGGSVAVGLYTHPFFGLTVVGQAIYLGIELLCQRQGRPALKWFSLALLGAIALYLPWIVVLITNTQRVLATTDWARTIPGWDYLAKLWTLSFTSLFFDLDFGFDNPWTYGLRLPFLVLIGVALYALIRRGQASVGWAITTSIFVPFLLLVLPDVVLGGKRSAVSRYLISCFPGVQLAIAHLLSTQLIPIGRRSPCPPHRPSSQPIWRMAFVACIAASLISLASSAAAFTWWNKDLSYFNFAVTQQINATPQPLIISDLGDDFTNTGDLLSLSYSLKPGVNLLLLSPDAQWVKTAAFKAAIQGQTAIAFRPTLATRKALEQTLGPLQPLIPAAHLWRVPVAD
jgi:uncharacterized membrane protein